MRDATRYAVAIAAAAMVMTLAVPVASAADGSWTTLAPAPSARDEVGYVQVDGRFYLMGKTKAVHVYDPATDGWSTGTPMPSPDKLHHIQLAAVGTKIYAIGGLTKWKGAASAGVYIYDTTTDSWSTGADMPAPRGAAGVVAHDGKIYVAGGMTSSTPTARFDVYDPATDSWTRLDDMPRTREHFHAVVADGRLWAIGGRNFKINNTVGPTDAYDLSTGEWESGLAPIPTHRGGYAAGVVDGEIVVMGGERAGIARPEVEAYDPGTDTWRSLTPMAVPRHGIQAAECDGGLYVAGGGTDQGAGHATSHHDVFLLGSATGCHAGGGGGGGGGGGEDDDPVPVGFGRSILAGLPDAVPTTLAWGPDGRLYVGYFDGTIRVYGVSRSGANAYQASPVHTITDVKGLPNHDDDGSPNGSVTERLLLGLALGGTASNPVIYASSSDPRIGGGSQGVNDTNLDTNSGVISRLTWTGSGWQHLELVRGLPRSEENHATNGLVLQGSTLYAAQGGNTNRGGPSNNFALLPEYAYSAAILRIDLAAIGDGTYDLPTLDDPDRGGDPDANDPFGGNDGENQARIVSGGPVQIHAPGFRNAYDLVIATVGNHAGKMYVPDNGPNAAWGDQPVGEGTNGCTNEPVEQGELGSNDALHLVTPGYYGGHPNPTRGNDANTFAGGQSPIVSDDPVECDHRASTSSATTSISLLPNSSNGIAEYTTDNFGGAMLGDLLTAAFTSRRIVRLSLDAAGTDVIARDDSFATFDQPSRPLDVVTMGPGDAFPGTIWIADMQGGADHVVVLEPNDFDDGGGGGGGGGGCTGQDDPSLDEDGDGYSNADEIDNGTNPCSAASSPPDNDGDGLSDLNDPNDDDDGRPDVTDPFAIDPADGTGTVAPLEISWENDAPSPGGIANTGFTGLMSDGTTDYLDRFDETNMVVGGAAGVLTIAEVPPGDAWRAGNKQDYGFQLGVMPPAETFTASTSIVAPFDGLVPERSQSMGLFIGDGTQANYVKIVTQANQGGRVNLVRELNDSTETNRNRSLPMPGPDHVDLFLTVDPSAGTVQGSYVATTGGVAGPRVTIGNPVPIPASWYDGSGALAVGIISTSKGPGDPFPATWDFVRVQTGTG